jgi:hypothetical protein
LNEKTFFLFRLTPAVSRLPSAKRSDMRQESLVSSTISVSFAQQGGSCAPAAARIEPLARSRNKEAEKEEVVRSPAPPDPARPRQPHPPHARVGAGNGAEETRIEAAMRSLSCAAEEISEEGEAGSPSSPPAPPLPSVLESRPPPLPVLRLRGSRLPRRRRGGA